MEAKPIVTSHGNQSLFSSLQKPLLEDLPKEPAEWRRSYGRPVRNVHLEASFVPYDDDILPDDSVKTLVSRLYFHIYWTDCDLDTYKQSVKEEISDWTAALKAKTISDWMIVYVNSDENKGKSKLLPRSSVYDKIKSDFCGKTPDRIVVLEPQRTDQKSSELWSLFLSRLRHLLLQAFTRHLQKYEDNMRALREKRTDVGWNFQSYFIVQEELAFMFEMLGLFDDALIQYDELDALFTQFVLNHASGQVVPWLKSQVEKCRCWAGLSLHRSISWEKRNMIKDSEASLLMFRNYLFMRQCALLLLMSRPGEIIRRAIDFLLETVQEMKTLNIEIIDGGIDCWAYLSGVEVLNKCEKLHDSLNPRLQALNTAYLWDYACRKLRRLGELCGLMPGSDVAPTYDQLSKVVDLTSGMGLENKDDEDNEESKVPSARDKLREALSSKEAFQKIYLEQSELAMGTFKYIGRFRSARMIGKNLADFYMKLGEPQKAENFLLDAMTSYHQEGWQRLRDMARLELAQCQYQMTNHNKYVKTACQVASSPMLHMEQRLLHMNQVLKITQNANAAPILLKASPLLKIEVTEISTSQVAIDESFQIIVTIDNNAPCDLSCECVSLTLADCGRDTTLGIDRKLADLKNPLMRQASNSSLDNRVVMNVSSIKTLQPSRINLCTHYEGPPEEPILTGVKCINSHELLKRIDSTGGMIKHVEETVLKDTMSQSACISSNVILKPGINTITLNFEGVKAGFYVPGQVGVKVGPAEFLKDVVSDLTVSVACDETYCEVIPNELLAGTKQEVRVCLHSGNTAIEDASKVKVISPDDLSITTSCHDNTLVLGQVVRASTCEWGMTLLQEPCMTEGEFIERKVAFDCSWLPKPLLTCVKFQNPFKVTHRLLTARDIKYIQLTVEGYSETQFMITGWTLEVADNKDVDLVCLNNREHPLNVSTDETSSFVWNVKSNTSDLPPLDMTFTFKYACTLDSKLKQGENDRAMQYNFTLNNFQTLLTVKADVAPYGDNKVCKSGALSTLKLQVLEMPINKPLTDQELMYEVDGQAYWNVHGKSVGIFTVSGGSFSGSVQVIPVSVGALPLPTIKLYKYTKPRNSALWSQKAGYECDEDSDDNSDEREPRQTDFSDGQIYYSCLGKQVQVYPVEVTGEVEVIVA